MPELSFNIRTENLEETVGFIKGISSISLSYPPLVRNDTEHHIFVEGDMKGINKLTQYLSQKR